MKQLVYKAKSKKIQAIDTEELIEKRNELTAIVNEAKEELEKINEELSKRLGTDKTIETGKYRVTRASRLSFTHVSLEIAKKYHAVKKVVDSSVLKPLYEKGIKIEGVIESEYILVTLRGKK